MAYTLYIFYSIFFLCFTSITAVYTGPFTLLSSTGLTGTSDPNNKFSAADHLVWCKNGFSLIDLDSNTTAIQYRSDDGGQTWNQQTIYFVTCPDGLPLIPRDSGYTVAVTVNPSNNGDRIVIVGGDAQDSDVWISDDCGATFTCLDTPEDWTPRDFPILYSPPSIEFEDNPLWMGGGKTGGIYSVGFFESMDGGQSWSRPICQVPGTCTYPYTDQNYYMFPNPPTMGKLVADTRTVYFFDDWTGGNPDLSVFYLNSSNYGTGWQPIPGADLTNAFGRKAWISSTTFGSSAGCWFSTDYDSEDLYVSPKANVNSINSFSTSRSPTGPWTLAPIAAPWMPRAGAIVLGLGSTAIVGGGLSFSNGVPSAPTFGDVWQIDAGICLLDSVGRVCSGHGRPNLMTVKCICDPGWAGDSLCGSCTPNTTYGALCTLCPTNIDGSSCNIANGGGYCDSQQGCVCNPGWTGASCSIPPPTPPSNNAPTGLSSGAAAGVSITVLTLVGAGLFVYFSGGPRAAFQLTQTKLSSLNLSSYLPKNKYNPLVSKTTMSSMGNSSSSSSSSSNNTKLSKDQAAARLLGASGNNNSSGISGYQISSGSYGSY